MATVQTARGAIDSSALGRVLVHEHIFVYNHEFTANYRDDFDEVRLVDDAVARLDELKAAGIDTIIDLTVLGLGRYIPRIAQVAARTAMNIIVSTGAYTFQDVPPPYAMWGPGLMVDEPEPMVEHFVRDIEQGVLGTSVRAAELKCAIDMPGLTPGVERVLRAIGQAHRRTGAPITVHTAPQNRSGLDAQRVLAEEGVDLADVIIGHCGDSTDLDYLMAIADKGSILGMDRFGIEFVTTTEQRIATIAALAKRGYLDRLTLSHDCSCWTDFYPCNAARHAVLPDPSYTHISRHVVPGLRAAGLSEADIDTMFIANPRRHFEAAAARFGG